MSSGGLAPSPLEEKRAWSQGRLSEIRAAIDTRLSDLQSGQRDFSRLCIYATGSFGRGEASPKSDIDLFILDTHPDGARGERSLTDIDQIRLKSALVEVCEDLSLPEFDGDGRFLTVHQLQQMLEALGGDRDDALNFFTARLLLLLESQPLYNAEVYNEVVDQLLAEYFKDFKGHEEDFLPAYLINDMVRFWKTLCLNYEHSRRTDVLFSSSPDKAKIKHKLKNLKLAFSRIMTCYSAVAALVDLERRDGVVFVGGVDEIVKMSPIDRLLRLAERDGCHDLVRDVLVEYTWFLENLGDSEAAKEWLSHPDNRRTASGHAAAYRQSFYQLLTELGKSGRLITFVTM